MGRHEAVAMGRPTDLVLDASLPKHKKRFVNPIKMEVTRRARTETILGKSPAIFNGHQPPQADDPYMLTQRF